jgi:hypothetical protein
MREQQRSVLFCGLDGEHSLDDVGAEQDDTGEEADERQDVR